ncbi:MAG: hypothetical protein F2839_00600 [Actinobacteria bacterium]|uniref:Unannotated protein n=1 Tax=freshwater metagenome TaxID=449393 RepID=A0A6J5YK09_9ZZZZ|nr:hypothetical protein [Actinomycetota bacterium]
MWQYIVVAAVVFFANVLPAFAPPTWSILVFFTLNYNLQPVGIILLGVIAAALGRYLLALGFRRYRHLLPHWYLRNMENAATHVRRSTLSVSTLFIVFFVSPLSSAQLFEAAGIMKDLALRPLIAAFMAGRAITYSVYVLGAQALSDTSVGAILTKELRSPQGIALQVLMVALLVTLGAIKWKPHPSTVGKASDIFTK